MKGKLISRNLQHKLGWYVFAHPWEVRMRGIGIWQRYTEV